MSGRLRIEPLRREHDRTGFDCGREALNEFLRRFAGQNERTGLGRTFVLLDGDGGPVRGYYTLAAASVAAADMPEGIRVRYPVPVALLARLAVDQTCRGRGYGRHLLLDALYRVRRVAEDMAIYAVAVDALDEEARGFYLHYGFRELLDDRLHLFLPMTAVRKLPDPPH